MSTSVITTISVVLASVLALILLKQYMDAPTVSVSASVTAYEYKLPPGLQDFSNADGKIPPGVVDRLKDLDVIQSYKFDDGQVEFIAELIKSFDRNIRGRHKVDFKRLLVYKVENSGNKAALDVSVVNDMSGVAQLDDAPDGIGIGSKDAIKLGDIPPRATVNVYFWTNDPFYSRYDKSFVLHKDGTVDIDIRENLGGIYSSLYNHWPDYLFYLAIILLAIFFMMAAIVNLKSKAQPETTVEPAPATKRRRRRARPKQLPPPD